MIVYDWNGITVLDNVDCLVVGIGIPSYIKGYFFPYHLVPASTYLPLPYAFFSLTVICGNSLLTKSIAPIRIQLIGHEVIEILYI